MLYWEGAGGRLYHGDCLEILRALPECSVDAVITDPPYGLGEVKDLAGLLMAWLADEEDRRFTGKAGFMGKEWDAGVPGPRYWREVYRVLKPGAHLLCFAGTRTHDLMSLSIRLAGFELRDTITNVSTAYLCWAYGSGFPKSLAVDKAIDRLHHAEREVVGQGKSGKTAIWSQDGGMGDYPITAPTTPDAQRWAGYGTALKPAVEPILVFRKPLSEKNLAANVLAWGTGGLNIDATRVQLAGMEPHMTAGSGAIGTANGIYSPAKEAINSKQKARAEQGLNPRYEPGGRWPPNFLLSHHPGCVRVGTKRVKGSAPRGKPSEYGTHPGSVAILPPQRSGNIDYAAPDGTEEVDAWQCAENCPVAEIDRQSGVQQRSGEPQSRPRVGGIWNSTGDGGIAHSYNDPGGASRYFPQFDAEADQEEWQCVPDCPVQAIDQQSGQSTSKAAARGGFNFRGDTRHDRDKVFGFDDTGGASRFYPQFSAEADDEEEWSCAPDCPVKALDEQAGEHKGGNASGYDWTESNNDNPTHITRNIKSGVHYGDDGSRFFPVFYCGKASRRERSAGCEDLPDHTPGEVTGRTDGSAGLNSPRAGAGRTAGGQNSHPTVKPTNLCKWLCRLITPPGGTVLDPFCGSGSIGVAALQEGFSFIGIERQAEYLAISRARLIHALNTAPQTTQPTLLEE